MRKGLTKIFFLGSSGLMNNALRTSILNEYNITHGGNLDDEHFSLKGI